MMSLRIGQKLTFPIQPQEQMFGSLGKLFKLEHVVLYSSENYRLSSTEIPFYFADTSTRNISKSAHKRGKSAFKDSIPTPVKDVYIYNLINLWKTNITAKCKRIIYSSIRVITLIISIIYIIFCLITCAENWLHHLNTSSSSHHSPGLCSKFLGRLNVFKLAPKSMWSLQTDSQGKGKKIA